MKRDCPLREPSRLLPFILACTCLAACGPAPTRGEAVRDVTFFVLSDIHVGAEDAKADPPVTAAETLARIRRRLDATRALVGRPYPARAELGEMNLGRVDTPRGVFVLGDLTDGRGPSQQSLASAGRRAT